MLRNGMRLVMQPDHRPNPQPALTPKRATWRWVPWVLLGGGVFAVCLWRIFLLPSTALVQVLVGLALTALTGLFPLRVTPSSRPFVADHIVIFLLLLTHGPEAAVVAATVSALVSLTWGEANSANAGASRWANPSITALAMGLAGWAHQEAMGIVQHQMLVNAGMVLLVTMAAALSHVGLKHVLSRAVNRPHAALPTSQGRDAKSLAQESLRCMGCAIAATLLHLSHMAYGHGALASGLAVLLMLLAALGAFFSQQHTAAAAQKTKVDAALREADTAAKHMREMAESELRFQSAFIPHLNCCWDANLAS
jgi:hypothetical protein